MYKPTFLVEGQWAFKRIFYTRLKLKVRQYSNENVEIKSQSLFKRNGDLVG